MNCLQTLSRVINHNYLTVIDNTILNIIFMFLKKEPIFYICNTCDIICSQYVLLKTHENCYMVIKLQTGDMLYTLFFLVLQNWHFTIFSVTTIMTVYLWTIKMLYNYCATILYIIFCK